MTDPATGDMPDTWIQSWLIRRWSGFLLLWQGSIIQPLRKEGNGLDAGNLLALATLLVGLAHV